MNRGIISILIVVMAFLSGCTNNEIVKEVKSPNGKYVARAFIRDGGATTDFSCQVSIHKGHKKLGNSSGNVFRGSGSKKINIWWVGNDCLMIDHDCHAKDIFKNIDEIYGIKIIYR